MNREKIIRNSLLKSLDPTLYFQQDYFTTQTKPNKIESDITTTKHSTIILRKQSYLNSPENQRQYQSPKKIGQSPRSPNSVKKTHKRFLSLVSSSQKTNSLRASKQKFRRLGCPRRSQHKLEYTPKYDKSGGRMNRAQSCKVIGLKNQVHKCNFLTPCISRDSIVAHQIIVPVYSQQTQKLQQGGRYSLSNTKRIPNIPQQLFQPSNYVNQSKQFMPIYKTNDNRQRNPHIEQKIMSQFLKKSQSSNLQKKVPPISLQHMNKAIHQNGYNKEAQTSRAVSTPIHKIQPFSKTERVNHFIIPPPQNIQYLTQFHPQQQINLQQQINPYQNPPQFHRQQQINPYQNPHQFYPPQCNSRQSSPFQTIQTFNNNAPNIMRNNEQYTYAYPIHPVYRVVQSRQFVPPKQNNFVQKKGINNDELINLTNEISQNDDRRKRAFDLIQRKLDELSSRTRSLNKSNLWLQNNQLMSTDPKNIINQTNKDLNNDKKNIINKLDVQIGKQNERQKILMNKPVGQAN